MLTFLRDLMPNGPMPCSSTPEENRQPATMRSCGSEWPIIGVQPGFLSVLQGGPPPTFEDLKDRSEARYAGLRDVAATLEREALSRTLQIPWFPDPPCVLTIAEALVQVAMHT